MTHEFDDEYIAWCKSMDSDEMEHRGDMEAYYCKPYRVTCRCGRSDERTEAELKAKGWRLSALHDDTELCPACYSNQKQWDAGIALGRAQKLNDSLPEVSRYRARKNRHIECPF